MERQYTTKEKAANWLYYHIWWVVAAVLLLVIVGSMVLSKAEQRQQKCDYAIGYVGTAELPAECVQALKSRLAAYGADVDGDGTVSVKISQYIVTGENSMGEDVAYGRTAEVALLTDISEEESYFFLVEYPEDFQRDFQLMANLDGSPSAEDDFGVWDKVYRWTDCPVLTGLELGEEYQNLLQNLYIGRRCFVNPKAKGNTAENAALWVVLTEGAAQQRK